MIRVRVEPSGTRGRPINAFKRWSNHEGLLLDYFPSRFRAIELAWKQLRRACDCYLTDLAIPSIHTWVKIADHRKLYHQWRSKGVLLRIDGSMSLHELLNFFIVRMFQIIFLSSRDRQGGALRHIVSYAFRPGRTQLLETHEVERLTQWIVECMCEPTVKCIKIAGAGRRSSVAPSWENFLCVWDRSVHLFPK